MAVHLIRLAAMITAGTALYEAVPYFGLENLRYFASAAWYKDWLFIAWFPLGCLLNPVIPVAKLIGAFGLVRFKPWAWWAAFIPLVIDLLLRLTGAINFAVQSYQFRYRELQIPKGTIVGSISMWPSYIIGFLCACAILFLLRPSVRSKFVKTVERIA